MSGCLMIAGCGDLGGRLARRMLAQGWRVHGLRRQAEALPSGVLPVAGDLQQPGCPVDWPQDRLDALVYCSAASQRDEAGYRAAYVDGLRHVLAWLALHGQQPRRVLFVSSSSVYAQQSGEWIDEASVAEADSFSGRVMREAEQVALASGLPASCVRLTGLYGPGRRWLVGQLEGGWRPLAEPPQYANRIHIEDAAGLLECLLLADAAGQPLEPYYLGVDDQPAPLHEVADWLCRRLELPLQGLTAGSRRSGSRRCSNARARALGWVPDYPGYREGYAALLDEPH